MHFVVALDQVQGMRAVLGLFEGVCTGAADGYARMANKPASTLLHLGPGLGNSFANLHNARRARSPMVNIIGEHATYHIRHDAPLTSDIEAIARPVSGWVRTTHTPDDVSLDTAAAIRAACTSPGQIATLILPGDASWNMTSAPLAKITPPPAPIFDERAVAHAASLLKRGEPTLLLLSGKAVLEEGLVLVGKIAAKTGAAVMSNRPTGRKQPGAGRPIMQTLAYPVSHALKQLEDFANIILVSTTEPVAFFAYPGKPSRLAPVGCHLHTLVRPEEDVVGALAALARENLNVVTVLFNNRAYRILQGELENVGAVRQGDKADSILRIDNPALDFVSLAQGMGVEASRPETTDQLNDQLAAALKKNGPHLIEVMI